MRVAYDHQIFASQRYGGISRYFVEIARNIPLVRSRDSAIRIIAPIYVNEYLKDAAGEIRVRGVKVAQVPHTGRIFGKANAYFSHMMLNHYEPDLIHETYYSVKESGPQNAKRVVTVHDMIHELFRAQFTSLDRTVEVKKVSISRADHVICISENTRQDLIRLLGINPDRTSVVHLGFSLSPKNRQSYVISDRPYLLYVGSRGGYKNFFGFIEAYAKSRILLDEFDIVAFGGGVFSGHEKSLLHNLKIPESKIFQVSGGDEILQSLYRGAALFVYPSLYEGFGIPPLEAMSYGCPVACSNTGSIPEVVGDAAALFDPYLIDSMLDSLERTLFESTFREALREKGFDRVKKYSWEKCAEETHKVYEQIL